jgi:DNA repair protein RadC
MLRRERLHIRWDELTTSRLREALPLVDIRVPDHPVVAGGRVLSFAGLDTRL